MVMTDSLMLAAILGVASAALITVVQFGIRKSEVTLLTLSILGFIALGAIATIYCIPALSIIAGGANTIAVGALIPMLFAAIGLYAAGLWLATVSTSKLDGLEWVSNFLTGPSLHITILTALVMAAATILGLDWLGENWESTGPITRRFLDRGIIPPATLLLFYWGFLLLLGKWWNAKYVSRQVGKWSQTDPSTVSNHVDRLRSLMFDQERLDERLAFLWHRHEQSLLVPRYISWAVPVLGFIGTVLGISLAADGIRSLIGSEAGLTGLSSELGSAIAPLGIAFDTTLIALTLSLFLTLLLALVQRSEEHTISTVERQLREHSRAS